MDHYLTSLKIINDSYNFLDYEGIPSKKLEKLSKINIFVGENNSGKSRFIRSILVNNIEFTIDLEEIPYSNIMGCINNLFSKIQREPYRQSIIRPHNYKFEWYDDPEFYTSKLSENFKRTLNSFDIKKRDKNSLTSDEREVERLYSDLIKEISESGYYDFLDIRFKKIYIPILRSLFALNDVISLNTQDLYEEKIINYYFSNYENIKDIEIFTGLKAYKYVKSYLLGDFDKRALVEKYQQFLSENFFDDKSVILIPKENHSELTIKIGDEEEYPIYELGDGIQSIIILTMPLFLNDNDNLLVFVEEPEKLIHPGLQRKLIECILKDEILSKYQYFFTTHSNHFLDITLDFDKISIFKVKKILDDSNSNRKIPQFQVENLSPGDKSALEILGVRNSSVFLSNCTIWVEGITDRKYFRRYLELYMDNLDEGTLKFREDYHYSFVEYGGNNITHWSFLDEDDEDNDSMDVDRLCSRLFLITDKDKGKGERHSKLEDCLGDRYYCLKCREVENLIGKEILEKVLINEYGEAKENLNFNFPVTKLKNTYLGKLIDDQIIIDKNKRGRGTDYSDKSGTIKSKSTFCEKALKHINSYNDLSDEAKQIAKNLYNFIKENNSEINS